MPDCGDSDCVSQVSDCVNFGKPRSGMISPEAGCVTAMSDFASDVDSVPGEPSDDDVYCGVGTVGMAREIAQVAGVSRCLCCWQFGSSGV